MKQEKKKGGGQEVEKGSLLVEFHGDKSPYRPPVKRINQPLNLRKQNLPCRTAKKLLSQHTMPTLRKQEEILITAESLQGRACSGSGCP
ncbi:MAG: hypothetical protein D3910_00500 [Candidatus Electrothrix sp. ATG2]|nr:hypothetical protein [Candidatus Electrothrix sp. ATG2]